MAGELRRQIALLVGLRRTIQSHSESWKRAAGLVLGALAVAATWAAALLASPSARGDVLAVLIALWSIGWILGPILAAGSSVLRPEYFTLLPLERRSLGLGLLASVFVGPPAGLTFLAMLSLAAVGATQSPAAAVAGLLAAVLYTVGLVSLSRAAYAVLGAAMRTQVGVEIAAVQYGLMIAGMIAGWLVVFPAGMAIPVLLESGIPDGAAATVLSLSPVGWPGGAVAAAADADALAWAWRTGALALAAAVLTVVAVALLTPHVGNRTARRRRAPWGSRGVRAGRGLLPATALGAVIGKELRSWVRDPWRSLEVRTALWIAAFLGFFLWLGGLGQIPFLFTFAPWAALAAVMMAGASAANLYGQDGTALWMLAVGSSPQALRADVRGRQVAVAVMFGSITAVAALVLAALSGSWDQLVVVGAGALAMLGVSVGTSALFSVVGASAGVDPAKRRNATDAGENPLILQFAFWASAVLAAPTLALAVMTSLGVPPVQASWWPAALVVVGAVNGALGWWLLGRVALQVLTARLPETFARLRYPGLSLQTGGTGAEQDAAPAWAGALSRSAQKSYLTAREQKEKSLGRGKQ